MHSRPGNGHINSDSPRIFATRPFILLATALLAGCGGGGGGGSVTAPLPGLTLTATPQAVTAGSNSTLTWSTTGATDCEGSGGWTGAKPPSGSEQVGPIRSATVFVLSCTGAGGTRVSQATISLAAPVSSISGRVLVGSTTQVDSDTNDPLAPRAANNSIATAQALPVPAIVGGYVALAGRGPPGASQPAGDPSDYYRVALSGGQTIELLIAADDPVANDLDLYLLDGAGNVVDSSLGTDRVERITVPASGTYYVEVVAYEDATGGFANYRLSIGQTLATSAGGALRLTDDFVPGELLLRLRPEASAAASDGQRRSPASAVGDRHRLEHIGGAPGREMLFRLPDEQPTSRSSILAAGTASDSSASPAPPARFGSPALRRKWETLVAIKQLRQDTTVQWAEPNWLMTSSAVPNDPAYARQRWHYEQIQLPAAWDLSQGDAAVTVAIVDSGIRAAHPDLAARLVAGKDFVRGTNAADGDGIDDDPAGRFRGLSRHARGRHGGGHGRQLRWRHRRVLAGPADARARAG